jgi:ribosomal protein S3
LIGIKTWIYKGEILIKKGKDTDALAQEAAAPQGQQAPKR